MTRKLSTIHWVFLFGLAALALYLVKYQVQDVKRELVGLRYDLQQEQESLRLLQAEWAYLNRPERLRRLASRYLQLQPYQATHIMAMEQLPMRAAGLSTPIGFDAPSSVGGQ